MLGMLVMELLARTLQCPAILTGGQFHSDPAQRSATLHLLCLGRLNQQGRAAGHLALCAAHGSAAVHRRAEHNLQRRCQTDAAGPGRFKGTGCLSRLRSCMTAPSVS